MLGDVEFSLATWRRGISQWLACTHEVVHGKCSSNKASLKLLLMDVAMEATDAMVLEMDIGMATDPMAMALEVEGTTTGRIR